jgi:hypothetical protein
MAWLRKGNSTAKTFNVMSETSFPVGGIAAIVNAKSKQNAYKTNEK